MPSIATEAAPRREHLLTTLRAGDTYGFLGRAEAYLQANPDDAEVCASVVRAYAALGQYQRAIQDFDKAIRLDPQTALDYNNRGAAYVSLGQYQRAIQDLDEAIRLDSQLAIANANRAISYTLLGKDEEAEKDVARAVDLGFDREVLENATREFTQQQ